MGINIYKVEMVNQEGHSTGQTLMGFVPTWKQASSIAAANRNKMEASPIAIGNVVAMWLHNADLLVGIVLEKLERASRITVGLQLITLGLPKNPRKSSALLSEACG